jgi:hypothetical protein
MGTLPRAPFVFVAPSPRDLPQNGWDALDDHVARRRPNMPAAPEAAGPPPVIDQ